MKKVMILVAALVAATNVLSAQDAQKVAAKVAETLTAASDVPEAEPKPVYWTNTLKTTLNFAQTSFTSWMTAS